MQSVYVRHKHRKEHEVDVELRNVECFEHEWQPVDFFHVDLRLNSKENGNWEQIQEDEVGDCVVIVH